MRVLKCIAAAAGIAAAISLTWFSYSHITEAIKEESGLKLAMEKQDRLAKRAISPVKEPGDNGPGIELDWGYLKEVNPDILAWVHIPGTYISFPLMQERILSEYYYLDHDYEGEHSPCGSLFTPAEPKGVTDAHMLVFGHHMKHGGIAFAGLQGLFSTKEAALKNPGLWLIYPDRAEKWEIWCAVSGAAEDMVYEIPYLSGTDSYAGLLSHMASEALFSIGDAPGADEGTVILSTCSGAAGGKQRFYAVFRQEGGGR